MLPRINRISNRQDYKEFFKKGIVVREELFDAFLLKASAAEFKLGVIVSTKVSKKASTRNRIRRSIHMFFRDKTARLVGKRVLVVLKGTSAKATRNEIFSSLEEVLKKIER